MEIIVPLAGIVIFLWVCLKGLELISK